MLSNVRTYTPTLPPPHHPKCQGIVARGGELPVCAPPMTLPSPLNTLRTASLLLTSSTVQSVWPPALQTPPRAYADWFWAPSMTRIALQTPWATKGHTPEALRYWSGVAWSLSDRNPRWRVDAAAQTDVCHSQECGCCIHSCHWLHHIIGEQIWRRGCNTSIQQSWSWPATMEFGLDNMPCLVFHWAVLLLPSKTNPLFGQSVSADPSVFPRPHVPALSLPLCLPAGAVWSQRRITVLVPDQWWSWCSVALQTHMHFPSQARQA